MELSQLALARLYLFSALLGAVLGVLYDVLRLFRLLAKRESGTCPPKGRPSSATRKHAKRADLRHTAVTFLADLFFCLAAGIALILLLYQYNNGNFRPSILLCVTAGGFFYRGTLGSLLPRVLESTAQGIKKAWHFFVRVSLFPFRLVFGTLQKCACKLRMRLSLSRERTVRRSLTRQSAKLLKKEMRALIFADLLDKKE